MRTLAVVAIGYAMLIAVILWLDRQTPEAARIAHGLLGEAWYSIKLGNDHVGFMYNHAHRDVHDRWHFRTVTHFRLEQGAPNTIDKHLVFEATPPYTLKEATYRNSAGQPRDNQTFVTAVRRSNTGYTAQLIRQGRASSADLQWQYSLEDFVGFELWLHTNQPAAGATSTAKSPDFEKLRVTQKTYRVVERNEQGYLISNNAPWQATTTQLNATYRPQHLTMAGIFEVTSASEAQAVALHDLPRKTAYAIPLDQPIRDHQRVTQLHLRLRNPPPGIPETIQLSANPITTSGDGDAYSGEGLRYPTSHKTIRELAQRALADGGDQPLQSLVQTTHRQMVYTENQPAGSVLAALRTGQGECTDYADLFTTIARAAGLPARTVYGLAYRDGAHPALMFHAWNEVYFGQRWHSVDPTWNQVDVDATHLPLSETQAATMVMAASAQSVSAQVLAVEYAD